MATPASVNPFAYYTAAELAETRAAYKNCHLAIASAGQTYSMAGRQFTRADLKEVEDTIRLLDIAIATADGRGPVKRMYPGQFLNY